MDKSSKKAAIYEFVLDKLLRGEYRFGEGISVKELGDQTGVSRQPIMSALNSLQERGFIKIMAQVGCSVAEPSSQEVSDFYHMFSVNEGLLASLAAQRGTPDGVRRLEEINDKIGLINPEHSDADISYRKLNLEFHHHLHHLACSPLVSRRQMANFELSDFFIVQSCGFKAHLGDVSDEHGEIIDALKRKDAVLAKAAAMEHIDSIAEQVVTAMKVVEDKDQAN